MKDRSILNVKHTPSIQLKRGKHFKSRYYSREVFFLMEVFKNIGAVHSPYFRAEVAAAHILIRISGIN